MDGGSYIVEENEPTFDIGEWMNELEAADQGVYLDGNIGMEAAGVGLLSADANEHRNYDKTDEKFWPKAVSKSDLYSGMRQTLTPTASNSDNYKGRARMGRFPNTSPMVSTLPLRAEASGTTTVVGSSTRQPAMSENFQKCLAQTNSDLMQQPGIGSDSDVPMKPGSMISQPNLQQVQQPIQLYPHYGAQNLRNELSHGLQRNIQETYHSQGLIVSGQLNSNQFPQRLAHEGSSASVNMDQNRALFSDFAEWHDEAYKQLLTMKRLYLTEVMGVYQRYQDLSSVQPSNAEFAIRLEKNRIYVGRIISFLNMPKSDIVHCSKEKMYTYMNQVTNFIYQTRAKLSFPSQYHHPIAQPQRLLQNRNFQFNMPNGGSASAAIGPNRFVAGSRIVRAGSNYISQQNSLPAIPELANNSSQGWYKQRAPDLLQSCSTGLRHQNAFSVPLMNSSPNEIYGGYDSSIRSAPVDSPVFQSQNPRNGEDLQFMQANKMQPQQTLIGQHKQQKVISRMGENNDLRFGESMCFSPTKFQQPCQEETSQNINHFSQTALSSNSVQTHDAPLQSGQYSSPQVDSNDCSSKVSKGSINLQSIGSPFVVPSPLTPLTPSSSIVDCVKKSSYHSPSLISAEDSRNPILLSKNEPRASDSNFGGSSDVIEVDNSHFPHQVESDEVQEPNAENGPFKRLLEVVKSSSQKALNSAVQDIGAVTNLIDRRAGATLVHGSRYIISHDLADEIQYFRKDNHLHNFEYDVLPSSSCASQSFSHLSELCRNSKPMASSPLKRLKTEANYLLTDEIKEVNNRLVETVAEIFIDKTGFSSYEAAEETIIHCSYFPVGQFATSHVGFPGLLLKLLVNRDYPHSSPSVMDVNPYNCSETEEVQAITHKAKSKFNLSLRKFSEPMSVSVMVKAWDVTAREVYHECAKKFGGESFSSKYGSWEECVTAA